ncbi:MAG: hypothetical protein AAFX56_10545 [Pseudomonadota bacterium]
MIRKTCAPIALLAAALCNAELPEDPWELENGYETKLLFLHALINYSFDPQWQLDWEREQYVNNALRVNTGSVSSDELLTEIDLNINEALNEDWRFFGQFRREGFRRRPVREDQVLLGLERRWRKNSAIYLGVNPEFGKEFLDIEAGVAHYGDTREQYARLGVRAVDLNWGSKNQQGGTQEQRPLKLNWSVRWPLAEKLWLYSEGLLGSGFERRFPDPAESPEETLHERNENRAELRLTWQDGGLRETLWALTLEWYDFEETRQFRTPGFDYDYSNTQLNLGIEHVRMLGERHRLRLTAQFAGQEASSRGFREHDYERRDILAGAFYEYLWPSSRFTIAYAGGIPDIDYSALIAEDSFDTSRYTDKLIVGWQYTFSDRASIRASLSQEVSERGFGGGAIQYQMFF